MWLQRLNRHAVHFEAEGNQWEVLGWSYQEHLPTNVPHRHTYFEACMVGQHGAGIFSSAEEEHTLEPGTFFLARPGAVHQITNTAAQEMELYWVSFSVTKAGHGEVGRLLNAFLNSNLVVLPDQEALGSLWRALLVQIRKPTPDNAAEIMMMRLLAQSVLLEIAQIGAGINESFSEVPEHYETIESPLSSSSHNGLARLGVQYVHDNMERSLTPDEIAHHMGVSRRQLTRLFSAYTGVPPALYIERARMDRSKGLLRAGQKSIKEVARTVGYSDVHHFTRAFTRVVGTSPARYRQEGAAAIPQGHGQHIQNIGPLV
ncbi:MAG: AraC family transcriptional regulator [Proteobacteria bacterium]|nr:MAG: AraC family transcriptional regulator [Pseudomonadota bacterium]